MKMYKLAAVTLRTPYSWRLHLFHSFIFRNKWEPSRISRTFSVIEQSKLAELPNPSVFAPNINGRFGQKIKVNSIKKSGINDGSCFHPCWPRQTVWSARAISDENIWTKGDKRAKCCSLPGLHCTSKDDTVLPNFLLIFSINFLILSVYVFFAAHIENNIGGICDTVRACRNDVAKIIFCYVVQ